MLTSRAKLYEHFWVSENTVCLREIKLQNKPFLMLILVFELQNVYTLLCQCKEGLKAIYIRTRI